MLYFSQPPVLNQAEQEQLAAAIDWYVEEVLKSSASALDRVRTVHRLIQQNVIYPRLKLRLEGAINVAVLPDTDEGRHYISAYGALVNERANSYGIARAVDAILCDPRLALESQLVEGCLIGDDSVLSMHLWNIVTIGHQSYHIDAAAELLANPQTVRRTGEPGIPLQALDSDELPMIEALMPSYRYCLVSDDVMSADHLWSKDGTPNCLSSYVPASWR
ncbi:MAG: hypothetical protein UDG94_00090 [Peptococcaceae bacterium]|nr:hypothetical protein [Peptococcaceae bacterium]